LQFENIGNNPMKKSIKFPYGTRKNKEKKLDLVPVLEKPVQLAGELEEKCLVPLKNASPNLRLKLHHIYEPSFLATTANSEPPALESCEWRPRPCRHSIDDRVPQFSECSELQAIPWAARVRASLSASRADRQVGSEQTILPFPLAPMEQPNSLRLGRRVGRHGGWQPASF